VKSLYTLPKFSQFCDKSPYSQILKEWLVRIFKPSTAPSITVPTCVFEFAQKRMTPFISSFPQLLSIMETADVPPLPGNLKMRNI
jgi:hypothetical protein